jgi:hypothetical protein
VICSFFSPIAGSHVHIKLGVLQLWVISESYMKIYFILPVINLKLNLLCVTKARITEMQNICPYITMLFMFIQYIPE